MKNETTERALGLSTAQVAGSALAAMSAALIASWAGTTGTIIGAAVGSVVATIGAATYTWSLRRTTEAVRRTAGQVRPATIVLPLPRGAESLQRAGERRGGEQRSGERHADHGEDRTAEAPTPATAETETRSDRGRSLQWGKVLLASAAVTAVVLGGITSIEALTGRTVSSFTGSGETSGTSLGQLVTGAGDPARPTELSSPDQEDAASPEDAPVETVTPDTTPTPEPTTTGSDAQEPDVQEPDAQEPDPATEPSDDVPVSPADPEATPTAPVP